MILNDANDFAQASADGNDKCTSALDHSLFDNS